MHCQTCHCLLTQAEADSGAELVPDAGTICRECAEWLDIESRTDETITVYPDGNNTAPLRLEHAAQAIAQSRDPFIKMRSIRVTFEDGDTLTTNINGTRKEITAYYVGRYFNHGIEDDRMVKAVFVEFLDTATTEGSPA